MAATLLESGGSGPLAQLVRAPARHAGGHKFDSCTAHHQLRTPKVPRRRHVPLVYKPMLSDKAATTGSVAVGHRFKRALTATQQISIIAELKRKSPSAGDLSLHLGAADTAQAYVRGGAACISVLTEGPRFGGSPEDLKAVKNAVDVPVLRKDFLTTPQHIHEAQAMGADAVLLIVEDIGSVARVSELQTLANELAMDALTEIRGEQDLAMAVEAGAYMIAVNQRDNPKDTRFTVDHQKAVRMANLLAELDADVVKVAASGIETPNGTKLTELAEVGYHAALIGEALVTAVNPTKRLRDMLDTLTKPDHRAKAQ